MLGRASDRLDEMIQLRENRAYLPGHPLPDDVLISSDPERALPGSAILVNCIPTQFIRSVWSELAGFVPSGADIASVAKGIESKTLMSPTQIIADVLGGDTRQRVATLSGPTIADELARRLPATLVAASNEPQVAERLQVAFNCDWFRVYTNADLIGVELAGATKNVIALAAGMLDGLQAGINAKSALLARGLAEIRRLGDAMGADPETFAGIAGVGDLATTCFSPTGRNRSCGELLGQGKGLTDAVEEVCGVVEGVATTESVMELARRHQVDMPITESIFRILFEGQDPLKALNDLMTRTPKPERLAR